MIVLIVINVLLFVGSVICLVGTHRNYERINDVNGEFGYTKENGVVVLTLQDGRAVEMQFGGTSVKIIDAYRYSDKDTVFEILVFVRAYVYGQGEDIQRANTELFGEYRLHSALYVLGYKREQTKDLDLDYESDTRWYVNVVSSVIGWCGL